MCFIFSNQTVQVIPGAGLESEEEMGLCLPVQNERCVSRPVCKDQNHTVEIQKKLITRV